MRRLKASHPDYAEINHHMMLLALIKNVHMHNQYESSLFYTPGMLPPENVVTAQKIEEAIDYWLDGGIFRDWIDG